MSVVRRDVLVWVALLALVFLTLGSAYVPMGPFNLVANLAIALAKMSLIMLFYMHLASSSPPIRLFALAGFLWLAILIVLTLADVLTRNVPVAG